MAGFLKSSDLGPHPHSYGGPHHPHHSHGPPLPPGMPMSSLAPFGLPHGLDAVGFPHQGMWGKYCFQVLVQQQIYIIIIKTIYKYNLIFNYRLKCHKCYNGHLNVEQHKHNKPLTFYYY